MELINRYRVVHPSSEKRLVALKLTTVTEEEHQNILDSKATVANADDDMERE